MNCIITRVRKKRFLRYDFYDSLLCNENAFIETKETIQLVVEYLKNELNED